MSLDFSPAAQGTPWEDPQQYWSTMDGATAGLEAPFAALNLNALRHNAHDMVRRAHGIPIRVASKSIRSREVIAALLALPGYRGVLAYTLPEAMWLAETCDDVVVGYPSADRAAIATLGASERLSRRVTLMVDSVEQLDLVKTHNPLRVCIELDSSLDTRLIGRVGVWRSPIRTVEQAAELAREIAKRPGLRLVGVMGYEAQIAGLGNGPIGKPLRGMAIRALQKRSMRELMERRASVVDAVRQVAELEFVNGGGTGSLEATGQDRSVTELSAGSGLFGPHLFDNYAHFTPAPAAGFALSVVRRPAPDRVTLLGGGWIASGSSGPDRLPQPVWPVGLKMVAREGAGEVQTPLIGVAAPRLRIGDRVWLRHTKAGELSEHVNELHIVDGGSVIGSVPTYRGEGKGWL